MSKYLKNLGKHYCNIFKNIVRFIVFIIAKAMDILKNAIIFMLFIIFAALYGCVSTILSILLNIEISEEQVGKFIEKIDSCEFVENDDYFIDKSSYLLDLVFNN